LAASVSQECSEQLQYDRDLLLVTRCVRHRYTGQHPSGVRSGVQFPAA
jgi:hypothetical protein